MSLLKKKSSGKAIAAFMGAGGLALLGTGGYFMHRGFMTNTAPATILGISEEGNDKLKLKLKYTPSGGSEEQTHLIVPKRPETTYKLGQEIEIRYDYASPKDVSLSVNAGWIVLSSFLFAFGVAFLIAAIWIFVKARKAQES